MLITDDARDLFKNVLHGRKSNAVQFRTNPSASGKLLGISLVDTRDTKKIEHINGVPVLIDEQTKEWTKTVFIDAEGTKIKLIEMENDACGGDCGSCGGCC